MWLLFGRYLWFCLKTFTVYGFGSKKLLTAAQQQHKTSTIFQNQLCRLRKNNTCNAKKLRWKISVFMDGRGCWPNVKLVHTQNVKGVYPSVYTSLEKMKDSIFLDTTNVEKLTINIVFAKISKCKESTH